MKRSGRLWRGVESAATRGKTINQKLAIVRRVLNLAARKWGDPTTGLTWLETPPLLSMPSNADARALPDQLEGAARSCLHLPAHLLPMALFMVHNAGVRVRGAAGCAWIRSRRSRHFG